LKRRSDERKRETDLEKKYIEREGVREID